MLTAGYNTPVLEVSVPLTVKLPVIVVFPVIVLVPLPLTVKLPLESVKPPVVTVNPDPTVNVDHIVADVVTTNAAGIVTSVVVQLGLPVVNFVASIVPAAIFAPVTARF